MKKLFLFLLFFALTDFASAQGSLVTGTIQSSASTCQTQGGSTACVFLQVVPQTNSADITVAGTYSGTLQFEVSGDGGATWIGVLAYPPNSTSGVTSTTGTGTWTASMAGHTWVRVRASALASGVASITLNPSQAVTASVSSGSGGSGTVTSVNSGTGLTGGPITTSGTLSCATPSASTIGCVESYAAVTNQWINAISTAGVPSSSQPSCENLSDSGTGCNATIANYSYAQYLDPTKYIYFYDDFMWGAGASATTSTVLSQVTNLQIATGINTAWNSSIGVAGSVTGQTAPWDSGAYGVAVLTSGAVSADYAGIGGTGNNTLWVLNGVTFDLIMRAKILSTASTSNMMGFFAGSYLESAATDGIFIAYDTNQSDTGWVAVCKASSTATRTAIAGTLDTNYHDFHVWATVAGTINFTVDGGATTTISTNVPTAGLVIGFASGTRTTAAKTMHVDYVRFYQNVTR